MEALPAALGVTLRFSLLFVWLSAQNHTRASSTATKASISSVDSGFRLAYPKEASFNFGKLTAG